MSVHSNRFTTFGEKNKHWTNIKKQVDTITDKLGMPIDSEIRELIVGLNIFKFTTTLSCYGHIRTNKERGLRKIIITPYVIILAKSNKSIETRLNIAQEKYKKAFTSKNESETNLAYINYDKFMYTTSFPYYDSLTKLSDLLTSFYKNRSSPYRAILTLSGSPTEIKIRNAGYINQYFSNMTLNKTQLNEYQKEFIDFGEFLKKEYFSDTPK